MDHPPAHRQGVGHDLVGQVDAAQRVEPTFGDRQVDRAPSLGRAVARVGTPFVHAHSTTPAGEEAGQQAPSEPSADDGDLVVIVRTHEGAPRMSARAAAARQQSWYVEYSGTGARRTMSGCAGVDDDSVLVAKPAGDLPSPVADAQRQLRPSTVRVARRHDLRPV